MYSSSSSFDHDGKQSHSELLSCKEATGNGYEEEEEEEEKKKLPTSCVRFELYWRFHFVPFWSGVVRPPQLRQSDVCFLSLSRVLLRPASCPLFFWLSFLQLSALILRRSPANRILFALRQDKHCPCVTPKTFHRLSHFQHGSDISIIGFFLLLKCSEETMRVKRKNERSPNKVQVPFAPGTH